MDSNKLGLIWAIDLGTTAFTIAYQFVRKESDLEGKITTKQLGETYVIRAYPNQTVRGETAVPTDLYYGNKKLKYWGHDGRFIQGQPDFIPEKCFRNWKLALHDSTDPVAQESRRAVTLAAQRMGKTPSDLLSDFLQAIYGFSFLNEKSTLRQYFVKGLEKANIEIVIAVPPGWPRAEHMCITDAAAQKGVKPSSIFAVSETECLFSQWCSELKQKDLKVPLKPGQTIMVVDAGGGTVCIVLYERTEDSFTQLIPSQSISAGSEIVTEEFIHCMKGRLEGVEGIQDLERSLRQGGMMFEDWKKGMDGDMGKRPLHVPVAGLQEDSRKSFTQGYIVFSPHQLRRCFEKSMSLIVEAVGKIFRKVPTWKQPKLLLLGGAYGCENNLLRTRLTSSCGGGLTRAPFDTNAGSDAIARGAILTRLSGQLISKRASRYSYGFVTFIPQDRVLNDNPEASGVFIANLYPDNSPHVLVITWIIRMGQLVESHHAVDHDKEIPRTRFFDSRDKIEFADTVVYTTHNPGDVEYTILKHEHWHDNVIEAMKKGYVIDRFSINWQLEDTAVNGTPKRHYPREALHFDPNRHKGQYHLNYRYSVILSDTESRFQIESEFAEPYGKCVMEVAQKAFETNNFETLALARDYELLEAAEQTFTDSDDEPLANRAAARRKREVIDSDESDFDPGPEAKMPRFNYGTLTSQRRDLGTSSNVPPKIHATPAAQPASSARTSNVRGRQPHSSASAAPQAPKSGTPRARMVAMSSQGGSMSLGGHSRNKKARGKKYAK